MNMLLKTLNHFLLLALAYAFSKRNATVTPLHIIYCRKPGIFDNVSKGNMEEKNMYTGCKIYMYNVNATPAVI